MFDIVDFFLIFNLFEMDFLLNRQLNAEFLAFLDGNLKNSMLGWVLDVNFW